MEFDDEQEEASEPSKRQRLANIGNDDKKSRRSVLGYCTM
jgi:hypothetical protein